MELLACGHHALAAASRLCRHLLGENAEDVDRVLLLTGVGLDHDMCCAACDASGKPVELIVVCEGCARRLDDDYSVIAVRGEPGITERPEPFDATLSRAQLPFAPLDIAAVPDDSGVWLLLGPDSVTCWHADKGETLSSVPVTLSTSTVELPNTRRLAPRVHAGGRFMAVVMDYGSDGLVVDMSSGEVTMRLDRQNYHPETTPFPVAFAEVDGELVIVHASDWNRLDISDPATGTLLTPRTTTWERDEPRPEHYLDYFHGSLYCSPSNRWIADDGWVWSPVGMPSVWNLGRWRHRNKWESEDGSSRQRLCQRAYHWDSPMCWIGEDRLVVSGIGGDDEALIPGVRIFDPVTGMETNRFAGPTGCLHSDGMRLFSAGADGMHIWDPDTGEHTGHIAGFTPRHEGFGELAAVEGTTMIRWRTS